ncbi:glutamate racemase [Chamaesiphon polymorphus]|uniref:Glutamate racemase n=1 Tax=Chamaesiphon polymorphus CCALA 037 TaxID=2107692 RepID=A0A2T1GNL8_9CYAN|nr:glutamate racemase [Chamaesiphon polymorphus]PSB59471.1 glutamate racemase [Chamaesiphon polymorphus CCALA 037]
MQDRFTFAPKIHSNAIDRIGVFDSGVGGLTVLQEIYRQLPQESVLYFGDTARVPYGTRTATEILQFTRQTLDWMVAQQVKMAIMACNTSSALALETVRAEYDLPILGVILPGARTAARYGRRIGVIATPATVNSNAYLHAIREANPQAEVWQVACPEFVPIVENNRIAEPQTLAIAKEYLQPLLDRSIDTLVYGCTHYPHLEPVFRQFVPPNVQFVNPAVAVVAAAAKELQVLGIQNHGRSLPTEFFVSGEPAQFTHIAAQWLPTMPDVRQIALSNVAVSEPLDIG